MYGIYDTCINKHLYNVCPDPVWKPVATQPHNHQSPAGVRSTLNAPAPKRLYKLQYCTHVF